MERSSHTLDSYTCPVDGCEKLFSSRHGARIHFRYHTDEEKQSTLLTALVELHDELGRPPTPGEMDEIGSFSVTTYQNHFSSWVEALRATGLKPHRKTDLSEAELLNEIHRLRDELGCIPTSHDILQYSDRSIRSYTERFGSWNDALRKAGYQPTSFRHIDDEDLIDEIHRLHDLLRQVPKIEHMNELGKFGTSTYDVRFGSWTEAVRTAGYRPRRNYDGPWNLYYGPDWTSRREEIIQRDNEQCRVCERPRSAVSPDLNVHHITPARVFVSDDSPDFEAMNRPSNLIALCCECHHSLEGLWRDSTPDLFVQKAREAMRI